MGGPRTAFFYDRSSQKTRDELIEERKQELQEVEDLTSSQIGSKRLVVIEESQRTINRPKREKQSDIVYQTLLNASKLLEGRFTFTEICNMDIPTFQKMVDNEMENISISIDKFKETGIINPYTRNEMANSNERRLKELDKMFANTANKKR